MKSKSHIVNELHDFLEYWLHRLSGSILQKFERVLMMHDVTHAQWYVLITIYHRDANTPKAIANFIGIDVGSVSRVIDRLILKEMLKRVPNVYDRRSVCLVLTENGELVIAKLTEKARQQEREWRACLNRDEVLIFAQLLQKLLKAQDINSEDWCQTQIDA